MTLGVLLKLRLYPLNLKQLGLAQGMCDVKKCAPDRFLMLEPPFHSKENKGGFFMLR